MAVIADWRRGLRLGSRKSDMENRVRAVPLLCQSHPSETNALADRADPHRNLETRDLARHDVHSVARHIVEASQARGHPVRPCAQVPQFIAATGIGRRGPLQTTARRNNGYTRKPLLHRV